MIWTEIAGGDNQYCAILVAINSILQMVLYAPMSIFFINIISDSKSEITVSYSTVAISVAVFLGIPLGAAIITRFAVQWIAGLDWYEVSNWGTPCRHNVAYWRGADWWGVGPGAHSHVGGTRWWNVKHPTAYADRLASGRSPAHAREVLDDETRRVERVLLELRLADGLPLDVLDDRSRAHAPVAAGLAEVVGDRLVLTQRGRLLADGVVRDLLP